MHIKQNIELHKQYTLIWHEVTFVFFKYVCVFFLVHVRGRVCWFLNSGLPFRAALDSVSLNTLSPAKIQFQSATFTEDDTNFSAHGTLTCCPDLGVDVLHV